MGNRSVFPTQLDTFTEHHELLASDIPNLQLYQQLLVTSPRTAAQDAQFTNLKLTLVDKIVSSEDINKLQDCITNLESFFTQSVDTHMQTTITNADSAIDAKVQSVKSYLDTTNVGSLRNDLGVPTDLVTTDKSTYTNAINEVKKEADYNGQMLNLHKVDIDNPHKTTAAQVGAYTTSQVDSQMAGKLSFGTNQRMEVCSGTFFTNGGSSYATANIQYANAFTNIPTISPANITNFQSYGDTIMYPYIYNITHTGFSVKINTYDASHTLGTTGSPANMFMNFIVIGS